MIGPMGWIMIGFFIGFYFTVILTKWSLTKSNSKENPFFEYFGDKYIISKISKIN